MIPDSAIRDLSGGVLMDHDNETQRDLDLDHHGDATTTTSR